MIAFIRAPVTYFTGAHLFQVMADVFKSTVSLPPIGSGKGSP